MAVADPIPWGRIVANGYGYRSILYAIERLLLMMTPKLPRQYLPNFEGITRALYDLGTLYAAGGGGGGGGTGQPPVSIGINPPGWDTATGTYVPGSEPADGLLWFDSRQGRLFVAISREWYQTNGAEALIHVAPAPPDRLVLGAEWTCTLDGRTYVYIDSTVAGADAGWFEIGPGPEGAIFLSQLLDVDAAVGAAAAAPVAAADFGGVLVRDSSVADERSGAWKRVAGVDEGTV